MAPDAGPAAARQPALSWSLVIPVKVLAQAKSRLTGLPGERRAELALAMAADTIAAAVQAADVGVVLVVTDDPEVGKLTAGLGAQVLPDVPGAGLNEALAHGAAYSQATWPERGRAGLAGDVPAARPGELSAALGAAARLGAAFVPDAEGTGTVLYAAPPTAEFQPRFGPLSRDRHLATGAVEITTSAGSPRPPGARELGGAPLTGLRRDVDTVANLREAAEIGVGPHTSALLAADPGLLT